MAAVTAALVGGAALAAGGSIIGAKMAADAQEDAAAEARSLAERGLLEFNKINLPQLQDQLYKLERIQSQGDLDPESEHAVQLQINNLRNAIGIINRRLLRLEFHLKPHFYLNS